MSLVIGGGGQWRQQCLCLSWTILCALRLTNLDRKPPWIDEFRTLVLMLGNSFKEIPLDLRASHPSGLKSPA
ncbi:MAG: hypothetical protein LH613_18745 [Chamaesiphon sp.]|nr:hypothetical protein [Chamaesiphon sp.]